MHPWGIKEILAGLTALAIIGGLFLSRERALWSVHDAAVELKTSISGLQHEINANSVRHAQLSKDIAALEKSLASNYDEHTRIWAEVFKLTKGQESLTVMEWTLKKIEQEFAIMAEDDRGQWTAIRNVDEAIKRLERERK